MTNSQNSKLENEQLEDIEADVIKEAVLNPIPDFYASLSNAPSATRLINTDTKLRVPRLVEFVTGSVQLDSQGRSRKFIPFVKQIHKVPPLIVGLGIHPRGNTTKFPYNDLYEVSYFYGGSFFYPTYIGIGQITSNGFYLNFNTEYKDIYDADDVLTTTYTYAHRLYKYKFRVYNLGI